MKAGIGNALRCSRTCRQSKSQFQYDTKEKIEDGLQSAVGCLQINSDKSQTFLLVSTHPFYSFYVTRPNFTVLIRRRLKFAGKTVIAYLPMSYLDSGSAATQRKKRIIDMATLHQCLSYVAAPLVDCALNSL